MLHFLVLWFSLKPWIIRSGPNSNSFELLCLSSLPASLTKIQSKVTEKSWWILFLHRLRARNSKMTGQIRPKFEPVRDFMPVPITCKFEEDWIPSNWDKMEKSFSPIQSQWESSMANNSVVKSPNRPKFDFIRDFMPVFVTASLTKIQLKMTEKKRGDTIFPIISQWEISVAMVTTVLIRSALKPNAAFPHPKDATDKIWLKSANLSWRYICSKVWTTTDDGALLYYKLTLWAFGSGELKKEGIYFFSISIPFYAMSQ